MRRHFPGTLYSVSPKIVKMIPTSILTNERVAWYGRWKYGTFIMVAVAATNVGDIHTEFDKDIATNNMENVTESEKVYEKPLEFRYTKQINFNQKYLLILGVETTSDILTLAPQLS